MSKKPKTRNVFRTKAYWEPTPKKFRKIGDALLGAFSITSISSIVSESKKLAIASLMLGIMGKVFTNFFVEENQQPPQDQPPI